MWVCKCLLESLFSLLLDIFTKGPVAVLCLTLKNNLFSTVAASSFSFSPAMNDTPISSHSCQSCLFIFFLIIDILLDVMWYLIMVLTCISLITDGIEHLFMYVLAFCISSFEKCLFTPIAHLTNLVACWCSWSSCLYTLDIKPLLDRWLSFIFLICGLPLHT